MSYRYVHLRYIQIDMSILKLWIYRKSMCPYRNSDISIAKNGHIDLDISEIDMSISDFRYIHSYKMDISIWIYRKTISISIYSDIDMSRSIWPFYSYGYIENGHIDRDVIKCIDLYRFSICPYRYTEFPIYQSFYPLPFFCSVHLKDSFLDHWQSVVSRVYRA